jgi:Na+-transporting NADH:ubiquinone oxidoreductase subunit F
MELLISILLFTALIQILLVMIFTASKFLIPTKPVELIINNKEPVIIETGQTLLGALYNTDIFIPSACGGKGTCGYCKVKINDGGGSILPTELDFLDRIEKKEGIRLACQVKILNNIDISIPQHLLDVKEFISTVESTVQLTDDIIEINLAISQGNQIEYNCGQYIQVKIPHKDSPGGYLFRAYSIASSQFDSSKVTLNVKLIPDGIGSTWLHNLEHSQKVSFTGPYGDWNWNRSIDSDLVLIGGGVGMAPMRSIILSITQIDPNKKIFLYFGARAKKDLFYIDQFLTLQENFPNLHIIPALSEPLNTDNWNGETGFISTVFENRYTSSNHPQAFLCGPPLMIESAFISLEKKSFLPDNIFYDKF